MGFEVPRVRTPLDLQQIRSVLTEAHDLISGATSGVCDATNADAICRRINMALAHLALEHARGAAVWCNNLGNVDAPPDWSGNWFLLTAGEVIGGRPVMITKRLRAFGHPTDGAVFYWAFLRDRCAAALARFDAGDPTGAAEALKAAHYYTARLTDYTHTLAALYAEFSADA